MEENVEYWKSRALTAEDAFRQIQSELKKERKERKEFEHLITQRFDQFCQAYEDRLLGEMMTRNQPHQSNHANVDNYIGNSSNFMSNAAPSSTPRVNEELVVKRSNTPTPRRAAPVPPARRSQA
jgi:hypothetical protein